MNLAYNIRAINASCSIGDSIISFLSSVTLRSFAIFFLHPIHVALVV
jgi:hypothetical protein